MTRDGARAPPIIGVIATDDAKRAQLLLNLRNEPKHQEKEAPRCEDGQRHTPDKLRSTEEGRISIRVFHLAGRGVVFCGVEYLHDRLKRFYLVED